MTLLKTPVMALCTAITGVKSAGNDLRWRGLPILNVARVHTATFAPFAAARVLYHDVYTT